MQTINNSKKLPINIGIDFGTSYSKVCFEESHKKVFIELNESNKPYYKRSEVYYDYNQKRFHYKKPDDVSTIETMKYFKYSIIEKSLQRSNQTLVLNLKTTPEKLYSVFFLACLIKRSKKEIEKYYKKHRVFQFDWNITMGVPIDNYQDEFKSWYDMILQIAIKLSESKDLNKYSIFLNDLDDFCQENEEITIPGFKESPNNTLSELYAESIAFLGDRNVDEGLYAIVDIGGATVDMAVISKMPDEYNKNKFKYGIITKSIEPLGIEILIHKIAQNDNYKKIKKLLENNKFKSTNIEFNKDEEQKLFKKMKEAFARLATDAKDKLREALIRRNGKMIVILCGGGAQYNWYKDCISSTKEQIRNTLADVPNGFGIEFMSVEKLKRYYNVIDHRLIISSGLAQDIQRIPDLGGLPWDYERKIFNVINIEDYLEKIMIDKYGASL
jgi:hypothetical protein